MNKRNPLLIAAALAALSTPALSFADYVHPTDGEVGYIEHPEHWQGTKTGQDVLREFEAFRRNPVSADGLYRYVGGEVGWESVPNGYSQQSMKTRQAVLKEFEAFRRNPVSADGLYRYVGGEIGWERLN